MDKYAYELEIREKDSAVPFLMASFRRKPSPEIHRLFDEFAEAVAKDILHD